MPRGFKKGHPTYNKGKIAVMDDPHFQKLWYMCHTERTISQVKAAKELGISIPTFMKYSEMYAKRLIIEGCMHNLEFEKQIEEIKDKYKLSGDETPKSDGKPKQDAKNTEPEIRDVKDIYRKYGMRYQE